MASTIKPNTRLKDQLIKQEAARLSTLAKSTTTLKTLLASLSQVAPAVIPAAVNELMDAASQYKASQILVDVNGRHSKPGIADARSSLLELHKTICRAQTQYLNLPINAITAVGSATDSALFGLKPAFDSIVLSIEAARYLLLSESDKPADFERCILAYQVAVVFRDTLKIKPSSTNAKQLKEINARDGAAYDRVLRATLKVAGVINYDSGPLITAGLRLLKDPNLPSTK